MAELSSVSIWLEGEPRPRVFRWDEEIEEWVVKTPARALQQQLRRVSDSDSDSDSDMDSRSDEEDGPDQGAMSKGEALDDNGESSELEMEVVGSSQTSISATVNEEDEAAQRGKHKSQPLRPAFFLRKNLTGDTTRTLQNRSRKTHVNARTVFRILTDDSDSDEDELSTSYSHELSAADTIFESTSTVDAETAPSPAPVPPAAVPTSHARDGRTTTTSSIGKVLSLKRKTQAPGPTHRRKRKGKPLTAATANAATVPTTVPTATTTTTAIAIAVKASVTSPSGEENATAGSGVSAAPAAGKAVVSRVPDGVSRGEDDDDEPEEQDELSLDYITPKTPGAVLLPITNAKGKTGSPESGSPISTDEDVIEKVGRIKRVSVLKRPRPLVSAEMIDEGNGSGSGSEDELCL